MPRTHRNREYWFSRLASLALLALAIWQPLTTAAAVVTWGCAIALAGIAASLRTVGRLG